MARPPSLQTRLVLRLGTVFGVALLLAVGVLIFEASSRMASLHDRALRQQADDIVAALHLQPNGVLRLDLPNELRTAYARAGGGYLYVVYDVTGRPVAQYPDNAAPRIAVVVGRNRALGYFSIDEPGAGVLFGLVVDADAVRPGVRIAVGQGSIHGDVLVDSLIGEFMVEVAWVVLLVIAVALVVAVMTIRSLIRPIEATAGAAAAIGPARTDVRLPTEGLPRELLPLVAATNAALDRLERAFAAQRRFTADAAHQLRTPLAILTARLEGMGRGEQRTAQDELVVARRDAARLNRIVSQLLDVARLEGQPIELDQPVDLCATAVEAVTATAPLAIANGVELSLCSPDRPVMVHGASIWLEMAVTNLIENAIQHAPAGSTVEISVTDPPAVTVSDLGNGIEAAALETIFEPFHRGTDSKPGGAGLGLAIVKAVAAAHGAEVCAANRPEGGAIFRIAFVGQVPR